METPLRSRHLICFGAFEFDPHTGELRKHGMKLKLHGHAIEALVLLLEHPGELVTREELRKRLWPADTFVDFEHNLNAAVKRLREALDDSADRPRFIETLPRHGYRFIATVDDSPSKDSTSRKTEQESSLLDSRLSSFGKETSGDSENSAGSVPVTDQELPLALSRRSRVFPYQIGVLVGGLLVGFAAVVITLNVGGLRDRLLSVVGGRRAVVSTPKIESIAVLPLENFSGDKEQEYFADGMTEALITDLGKIGALRVISRTSVMQYKGTKKPLPQIARELNVDAIVEGTVQRSDHRVRITANLLHAPNDRHLWAETYERDLRDVLALQDEVARAIASKIQIHVTSQEQTRLASVAPVNPEAYRLYLQGRYCYFNRKSAAEVDKSIQLLQQAIEKEPGYALAYAGLAESYCELVGWGGALPKVAFPKAMATALKALELDSSLAEVHAALGLVLFTWDWDWSAAERELKRAIELNPSCVIAHHWYAEYLTSMGRHEQAITEATSARELDPLSLYMVVKASDPYIGARRYDEAIDLCRKALEIDPNYARAHHWIGMVYIMKGMANEAAIELDTAARLGFGHGLDMDALVYAAAGRQEEIRKLVGRVREQAKRGEMTPFALVQFYTALGDKQTALGWLEKAYDERDPFMPGLKGNHYLDPLRSDPRYQGLLRRMNFPP